MIGPANTMRLRIVRTRRDYSRWVANDTLEDFALRFTPRKARIWSPLRVANTALGSISFLALEAIGGTLSVTYGVANTAVAILLATVAIFLFSLPVCVAAARNGLDIDLLTRAAGFGYVGSTVTSLIYATFTFLFFGIEAAILASMLHRFLGVPPWLGDLLCAAAVIPLVSHGFRLIARLQLWSQPVWLLLNAVPLAALVTLRPYWVGGWVASGGLGGAAGFDLLRCGAAASIVFILISQSAEQVDFMRFLPDQAACGRGRWWLSLVLGGPGWILFDGFKLLAGSLLAYAAVRSGLPLWASVQPAEMYQVAYRTLLPGPAATIMTIALVSLSQIKINVTNAYAGSLAWSNFFSRLTHAHPGRVFYVVFNVVLALALMESGSVDTIQQGLTAYADLVAAWIGAIVGHLVLTRPLGLAPPALEFRRAHLPDINPVGLGAMLAGVLAGLLGFAGVLGAVAGAFSPFLAFGVALLAAPTIARATGGRTFLARKPRAGWAGRSDLRCVMCEHAFEPEDMAHCPVYGGAICSLCCSLDARCHDGCKPPRTRLALQIALPIDVLPERLRRVLLSRPGRYALLFVPIMAGLVALLLGIVLLGGGQAALGALWREGAAGPGLLTLMLAAAVISWLLTLAQEARRDAAEETRRQTQLLMDEIKAHRRTDAQLQKAKEKAEAASIAKSRYVGGISHELRSPLNAILGYAQLMERDARLPPERRDAVRIIRESGEHLEALIGGLLDIARIEAGRIDLRRDPVHLPSLVEGIVKMMRPQAEAKKLRFEYKARSLPAIVRTDPYRLRQILINLLSNAVKFTRRGEIRLTVSWRAQIADFEVADTGPGIAAADIDRIFEPFERATDAGVPGTGLGLTITRLLTEILGGELTVRSEPGVGSRFRARLMLSDVAAPQDTIVPVSADAAPHPIGYEGLRRRILVVDDQAAHRALLRELLVPLGFELREAAGGQACLDLAPDFAPDLFLLDLSMPGMDGRELALRLRERDPDVPILFVTATPQDLAGEDVPAGEVGSTGRPSLGNCAVLSKPVDLGALLDQIGRQLKLGWVFDDPDSAHAAGEPGEPGEAEWRDELAALARLGDIRGIRVRIDALNTERPDLAPVLAPLRQLCARYEIDALRDALGASSEAAAE